MEAGRGRRLQVDAAGSARGEERRGSPNDVEGAGPPSGDHSLDTIVGTIELQRLHVLEDPNAFARENGGNQRGGNKVPRPRQFKFGRNPRQRSPSEKPSGRIVPY